MQQQISTEKEILALLEDGSLASKAFKNILYHCHGTVLIKDNMDRIVWVNKNAGIEFDGFADMDLRGRSPSELFSFIPKDKYYKIDLHVIKTKKPRFNMLEKITTVAGDVFIIRIDKIPFLNKEGICIGVITYLINITTAMQSIVEKYSEEIKYQELRLGVSSVISSLKKIVD